MTNDEGRTTNSSFVFRPSSIVGLIVATYLVIGTLYAIKTPAWQVPDEPTHYNYVRFVAEGHGLPVLQKGDYDQDYLESIKAAKFPPSMAIDSIRYEFHQPPLYYVLAAPIYLITGGSLLALRLFSVALGGLLVVVAFLLIRQVVPNSPALALGTAAFVAFVPQHVAMLAGVENDSLAELLLAAIMWQTVQISNIKYEIPKGKWVVLGALLGLGLVTKSTVYVATPIVLITLLVAHCSQSTDGGKSWTIRGVLVFGPALLFGLPWWIRNLVVYGWPDWMGLMRHDVVVFGQLTPVSWVAQNGYSLGEYVRQYAVTTFHSFWGQFGWMGVPMNERYYGALAILSLAAGIGFIWWLGINFKGYIDMSTLKLEIWHLIFLLWFLSSAAGYIWYNTKYVQFQGRYLFPTLIPIGLMFTVGLRQWTTLLPRTWRDAALAVPFAALAALDVVALFRMIVPVLTR
jgi:4-amino-4-deoxy-L-arabinose transferase-like glycosyltransferase